MSPDRFTLFSTPWWVNLSVLVPVCCWFGWRRGLRISGLTLVYAAIFALAFGFVEAAVVVYIRASVGMLAGVNGTLSDVIRESAPLYRQPLAVRQMPPSLLKLETLREAATIVMLVSVAMLASRGLRERCAMFLWCFALWDLAYYGGLWAIVRWPQSMLSPDVLFLIPQPWLAQVWFPILVSGLTVVVIILRVTQGPAIVEDNVPLGRSARRVTTG